MDIGAIAGGARKRSGNRRGIDAQQQALFRLGKRGVAGKEALQCRAVDVGVCEGFVQARPAARKVR